jgi:hypothetical protein
MSPWEAQDLDLSADLAQSFNFSLITKPRSLHFFAATPSEGSSSYQMRTINHFKFPVPFPQDLARIGAISVTKPLLKLKMETAVSSTEWAVYAAATRLMDVTSGAAELVALQKRLINLRTPSESALIRPSSFLSGTSKHKSTNFL